MKKRGGVLKVLVLIIVAIIVLAVVVGAWYVWSKVRVVEVEELDKEELDINENLYEEVSNTVDEEEFNEIITIAFFGSDSRNTYDMSSGRSDSIMLASINPKQKSIKFISIPRDTYVSVPGGYGWTKINHAYAYGGEQLSIKTINSNFGLNIDKYVTIDFSGLINVINEVGGIELDITQDELRVLNQYLPSSYQTSGRTYKRKEDYGYVTLNGEEALAHSRNRYVGSDFDRANRQRDVLIALMKKVSTMEPAKIMDLLDEFLAEVKTNVNVADYMGLISSIIKDKDQYLANVISTQIPSTDYASGQMIDGIYYFVGDLQKCRTEFVKYLYEM